MKITLAAKRVPVAYEAALVKDGVFQKAFTGAKIHELMELAMKEVANSNYPIGTLVILDITIDQPNSSGESSGPTTVQ